MSALFILPSFHLTRSLAMALAITLSVSLAITLSVSLAGCAAALRTSDLQSRLDAWLPADVLLLGEQHDAPEHQVLQQKIVDALAARGVLAAVALEMADSGSSTAALKPDVSEEKVRVALNWNNDAWPWAAYGPAVMSAVRAGVPVLGANLPRANMRSRMADAALDQRLPAQALKAQQQLIRQGHCDLLPESQITPMTRIQIAKDRRMADTDKQLGVPQHLPPELRVKAIRLQSGSAGIERESFDAVWVTPAIAEKDYCAQLRATMGPKAPLPSP
jgi:uncharacterized iron-regulated protein